MFHLLSLRFPGLFRSSHRFLWSSEGARQSKTAAAGSRATLAPGQLPPATVHTRRSLATHRCMRSAAAGLSVCHCALRARIDFEATSSARRPAAAATGAPPETHPSPDRMCCIAHRLQLSCHLGSGPAGRWNVAIERARGGTSDARRTRNLAQLTHGSRKHAVHR